MLSRVADSLYWMSRYLERAEHTARLLDVNLNQMLDQTPELAEQRWDRLLTTLHAAVADGKPDRAYAITETLTFAAANPVSIVACIGAARENARQVREQISSEMWEQINRLYLQVRRTSMEQIWNDEPHEFFKAVREGAHLFQGITDATMSHGEGWQFIQVGRFIERAINTAVLVDTHFLALPQGEDSDTQEYLEWVGLLKSCTAFEAYCKVYTANVQPQQVAEFLLLNADFPRSVRFSASMIQTSLQAIADSTGQRHRGQAERLAGRLRAGLDYGQVDEILAENLHGYLENIQRQCVQIHMALHQTFITYPIDAALAQSALVSSQ
ncbi:MAG: alpha-E domain-containing protein [Roseiflexaceae bacterium]